MSGSENVTVVTGANSGIGLDASHRLARRGGTLVVICRNEERGLPARDAIRRASGNPEVHLITADFASLAQVRDAAARVSRQWPRVTALVNNAGLASMERRVTEDGFELTLQVNHLAPFLLTRLLAPSLRSGRARVVTVASDAHKIGRLRRAPLEEIFRGPRAYRGFTSYGDSKLANILFTFELARREAPHGVSANALHPGALSTAIWDRNPGWRYWLAQAMKLFMQRPEVGGRAVERLVTDLGLEGVTGAYFDRMEKGRPNADARDAELARALWDASERAVKLA